MYWNHVKLHIKNEATILTSQTLRTKNPDLIVLTSVVKPESVIINSAQDQILAKHVRLNYKQCQRGM